ncbi:hypothetical protein F4Y59_08255 [Candidatus Poribacteria bacterium]|nr:hypothetical protein [Candidatus Poribacteria bacterium]MXY28135.1 hypothetical protein [Candidatus Poribacteria bacterium]MYK18979.1 hypothetical protein [Candidatus Poribacteria bacterium]
MLTEEHRISSGSRVKLKHDPHSNSQSPADALEILIQAVDAYTNDITALTEDDYDRLVVLLGELTDIVRDDENHIFAPLMEFAIVLIERYDHAQMPELAERIEKCRAQQFRNARKGFATG